MRAKEQRARESWGRSNRLENRQRCCGARVGVEAKSGSAIPGIGEPGDRGFLLKQGRHKPVGLFGSGIAASSPYQELHDKKDWAARGNRTQHLRIEFDCLVDGMQEVIISRHELLARFPQQHWVTEQSGIQIKSEILLPLQQLWEQQTGLEPDELFSLEDSPLSPESEEEEFPEGREFYRQHRIRERNQQLVKRAKEKRLEERGDLACDVCGFDFFDVYGTVGESYIECHHTKPVSELQPAEKTSLKNIALVCANCHRMLQRKRPWLSILQLGVLYTTPQKGTFQNEMSESHSKKSFALLSFFPLAMTA